MTTPNDTSNTQRAVLTSMAAAAGSTLVAAVSWALIGYYIASTLSLGLILLPLVSGVGAGFVLRLGRKGLGQRIGLTAILVTLLGCVAGDLVWISLFTQKPLGQLLGFELIATLNTLFNPQKAVMYAVAAYLSYAIASPAGTGVTD